MKDITDADKNFAVKKAIEKEGITFYGIEEKPFKVYGVFREGDRFRRLPEKTARGISEGVYLLHANTAGGRVRFVTDSKSVSLYAELGNVGRMPHFPLTGSAGFDLYVKTGKTERYAGSFVPPYDMKDRYESVISFKTAEMREITVNFPLYSEVKNVYIGLENGARVSEAAPYENRKPTVYYGSSVTQGGCASRPGNSYQAAASRALNRDYINLGFSGSARAEDAMAEYIKALDMDIFVYDYDYNAPTAEYLEKTHEKMFLTIRKANPELPIIMMSIPSLYQTKEERARLEIIKRTYNNALASGDRSVYLIDGKTLMKSTDGDGTVDGCHPSDLGFHSMAKAIISVMKKIIKERGI